MHALDSTPGPHPCCGCRTADRCLRMKEPDRRHAAAGKTEYPDRLDSEHLCFGFVLEPFYAPAWSCEA